MESKKFTVEKIKYIYKSNILLWLVMLVVALNSIYFINVFPINVGAYDYPNYLMMIIRSESNLIHASGYPFLIGFILDILGVKKPQDIYNIQWLKNIQYLQLALSLVLMYLCALISSIRFGHVVASIMILLWGGNILFWSGVNLAGPEWLQGELIVFSLLLSIHASYSFGRLKILFYLFGFCVLTFAYLVKYNSLLFFICLLLILMFDEIKLMKKTFIFLISLLMGFSIISSYKFFYHQPTTGSNQLSYDHAWVLIDSIEDNYFKKDPELLEINSLKWRALSTIVPPEYYRAAAYTRIEWGAPPEVRDVYRKQYEKITNYDRRKLIEYVKNNDLPANFNESLSSIPFYYYFGLPVTDKLGIEVYKEAVISNPKHYFTRIMSGLGGVLNSQRKQIIPFFSSNLGLIFDKGDVITKYSVENRIPQHMPYWHPLEYIYTEGAIYFENLNSFQIPAWIIFTFLLFYIFNLIKLKNYQTTVFSISIGAGIIIFIAASQMLIGFRSKEMISLIPTISLFISIGVFVAICKFNKTMAIVNGNS